MLRSIALAVWVCAVVAGAGYGAATLGLLQGGASHAQKELKPKLETQRARQISVPIMTSDAVAGYVVIRIGMIVDVNLAKTATVKVEDLVVDEAFKAIHSATVEFAAAGRKSDLDKITGGVVERVNQRSGSKILHGLLVQEFAFVDKKDTRK